MTEQDALLILNAIGPLTNIRIRQLVAALGSATEVFAVSPEALCRDHYLTPKMSAALKRFDAEKFLEDEKRLMERLGVRVVTESDEDYPSLLRQIPDAPVLLYWKGACSRIESLAVAIVGSRQASTYGLDLAERFGRELAELGVTVVSGMARGIDARAHWGTVRKKGLPVAVLGSGLANVYPSENRELFAEITGTGVALSEYPMRTDPLARNFPRRNRIISGLALGVIVIEAFERSGALITSRMALEQGREVFAVPGNIHQPQAKGTNKLIQQGAKLMTDLRDVLEELRPQMAHLLQKNPSPPAKTPARSSVAEVHRSPSPPGAGDKGLLDALTEMERQVYDALNADPRHIDVLADQCGLPVARLAGVILTLEMKGLIRALPGKCYVKRLL